MGAVGSGASVRITVVIPFLDCVAHLRRTAPGVLAAAHRTAGVDVIYVDNGSTDGSTEFVRSLVSEGVRLATVPGATISALRNHGATLGTGEFLSFLDADCGVDEDYFHQALAVMGETGADATGCEYAHPHPPHWIEATLTALHSMGRERSVTYINAGNFFIRRRAFEAVGGFREDLRTDEDSDIGARLVAAGFRIHESPRVRAVHYGNPKSLRQHYRRTLWHASGAFAQLTRPQWDRPTVMLALHAAATLVGLVGLFVGPWGLPARLGAAALLQVAVPLVTVLYRIRQTGRVPRLDQATLLYWVYYWARLHAVVLVATGAARGFRK